MDDHDPDLYDAEPQLTARAWARVWLTAAVAIVLISIGADGWSASAWMGGSGLLAGLTVIRKGYWQPYVLRQIIGAVGLPGTLGITVIVLVFNAFLSAALIGAGILLGTLWRIIP